MADADQDWADINELLSDPNLSPSQRKGYLNLKMKLRHSVAEELGELPSRMAIETDKPLLRTEIIGVDMDRVFARVISGTVQFLFRIRATALPGPK